MSITRNWQLLPLHAHNATSLLDQVLAHEEWANSLMLMHSKMQFDVLASVACLGASNDSTMAGLLDKVLLLGSLELFSGRH